MSALVFFLFTITSLAHAADPYGVGQMDFVVKDLVRNRTLNAHLWYPIDSKTRQVPLRAEGPFVPVVAAENAMLARAPSQGFPIVLISHGSGGRADRLFWLTEHYVKNGIVVLGVDHQGNMTGDNSADGLMCVWNRPRDMSLALDRLLEIPEFRSRLDQTRISAIGHSAGGTTVLMLAGARFSSNTFTNPIPMCAGTKDPYYAQLCQQLKKVDFKKYPQTTVEADYWDARLKSVVALDPGFAKSFHPATLGKLNAKAIVFVADRLNAPQDEIYSKEFVKLLPSGAVEVVPNSIHMSFISACKQDFPKDDPELRELCADNEQKLKIQTDIAAKSLRFFHKSWNPQAE
jgi:predicted dienelactone hydrolase